MITGTRAPAPDRTQSNHEAAPIPGRLSRSSTPTADEPWSAPTETVPPGLAHHRIWLLGLRPCLDGPTNVTVKCRPSGLGIYSGSRLHDARSGVPKPAEDVLGRDLS